MLRVVVGLAALALLTAASILAEAQAPVADGPTLSPAWNLTGDFNAPESAYYDAGANAVFVSSINGQILEKDGNGFISRLSPDGKVVNAKWVTGLNAPKGLRSVGGTLWVSDIDEVVSAVDVEAWARARSSPPDLVLLPDVDHFFHGRLTLLRETITGRVTRPGVR